MVDTKVGEEEEEAYLEVERNQEMEAEGVRKEVVVTVGVVEEVTAETKKE